MEVSFEDGRPPRLQFLVLEMVYASENVDRGLSEHPALRVIPRHDPHADAEIAVSHENVDGLAQTQLGLYLLTMDC